MLYLYNRIICAMTFIKWCSKPHGVRRRLGWLLLNMPAVYASVITIDALFVVFCTTDSYNCAMTFTQL